MYTIKKEPNGLVVVCHDCPHVERVDAFNKRVGQPPYISSRSNEDSFTRSVRLRIGASPHAEQLQCHGTGVAAAQDTQDRSCDDEQPGISSSKLRKQITLEFLFR
jgi:hypothetical protein